MDAYLDIETTGLTPNHAVPTVVGIAVDFPGDWMVVQLVGNDITRDAVLHALEGVTTIYTYNGSRFDIPFLAKKPGVDFGRFEQRDLMYDCWNAGHYGGLKVVERKLRIRRKLPDVDGRVAVDLWHQYQRGDAAALDYIAGIQPRRCGKPVCPAAKTGTQGQPEQITWNLD